MFVLDFAAWGVRTRACRVETLSTPVRLKYKLLSEPSVAKPISQRFFQRSARAASLSSMVGCGFGGGTGFL
jgi:hypothetical protein